MKPNKKRLLLAGVSAILVIMIAVIAHTFVWGKLFPYSPIIVGFDKHELLHVTVYIQKGNRYGNFNWVDSLIGGVEEFHQLRFRRKPKIFFFADSSTYFKRSMSKARMCAYYNGAVEISPWAQAENSEGKISLRVYLRHELSHSLLYQNMNLLRAMRYPRWLLEGIATYSANQMGSYPYPAKEETYDMIRKGNWMPPQYYHTNKENDVTLDVDARYTFMYSQFACIVDDLINSYGRDALLGYMKGLIHDSDHDGVFEKSFGTDFNAYLDDFKNRIESASR